MMPADEIDPMGWRLSRSVVRGEIDNRVQGRVTGRIWLLDRQFPLELRLQGNALRDLAGCLLSFENPSPEAEDTGGLCPIQMGRTGEISASGKMNINPLTPEQIEALQRRREPVIRRMANCLRIEWFSNANGRVLLETTDFKLQVSAYDWRMSPEDEQVQIRQNRESAERWADIVAFEEDEDDDDRESFLAGDDWEMDEFDWERQLQESDAMTERYMALIEAYLDHPERERMIAHEMGWDGLENVFDPDDDLLMESPLAEDEEDEDWEPVSPLVPVQATEGRDWVRDRDGRIRHPLTERSGQLVTAIWRACKEQDAKGGSFPRPDLNPLLSHAQTLNAKLSGALDGLAYDEHPEGGLVVACLKRSLGLFGQLVSAIGIAGQQHLLPDDVLHAMRNEVFLIRQDVLNLMQHYRQVN